MNLPRLPGEQHSSCRKLLSLQAETTGRGDRQHNDLGGPQWIGASAPDRLQPRLHPDGLGQCVPILNRRGGRCGAGRRETRRPAGREQSRRARGGGGCSGCSAPTHGHARGHGRCRAPCASRPPDDADCLQLGFGYGRYRAVHQGQDASDTNARAYRARYGDARWNWLGRVETPSHGNRPSEEATRYEHVNGSSTRTRHAYRARTRPKQLKAGERSEPPRARLRPPPPSSGSPPPPPRCRDA